MKDMISSLKTAVTERIKNPLIGTFLLSWIFTNRVGLTNFYFGDSEIKKSIIAQYSIDPIEVALPISMTIGYVVLSQLILPFIQHHLDKFKLKNIDNERIIHKANLSITNSKQEAKANREKYKTNTEYIKKMAEKELLDWEEERITLEAEIEELNKECDELDSKREKFEADNRKLNLELEDSYKLNEVLSNKIESVETNLEQTINNNENLSREVEKLLHLSELTNKTEKETKNDLHSKKYLTYSLAG